MASKLKFKLQPDPTFKADVDVPVPGAQSVPVCFEFKHYSQSKWDAYLKDHPEIKIRDAIGDVVVGWEIEDEPFSAEALEVLLDEYPGAAAAIWDKYHGERFGVRAKN